MLTSVVFHGNVTHKEAKISILIGIRMLPLREMRLRKGLTQGEFARQIGWSKSALQQFEHGVLVPGERLIARLAEALNLSMDDAWVLCGGSKHGRESGTELSDAGRIQADGIGT